MLLEELLSDDRDEDFGEAGIKASWWRFNSGCACLGAGSLFG
jgi:hypothetical protein